VHPGETKEMNNEIIVVIVIIIITIKSKNKNNKKIKNKKNKKNKKIKIQIIIITFINVSNYLPSLHKCKLIEDTYLDTYNLHPSPSPNPKPHLISPTPPPLFISYPKILKFKIYPN